MFSLKDKSIVITGGGSGIGQAIAEVFATQGGYVHILEKNADNAAITVDQILSNGGNAKAYIIDITDQNQVTGTMAAIGHIDILVNNAGIAHIGSIEQTTEADLDRMYSVNIKGSYNCMLACIPQMKERKNGVILNIASVSAFTGIAERFAYSMTKGALITMTLSVAKDYVHHGIRCNSISPARVHTPFVDGYLDRHYPHQKAEMFEKLSATQPIGRMAKPQEVAHLALYLCSDEAAFITGCDYPIDGGFTKLNT
jgi:2-keto-3-deoxy-L-fuconate dehydrogenase